MSVCVYDNPASMTREGWQDGKLLMSVSANVLETKGYRESGKIPWILNIGEWKPGQISGDIEAIDENNFFCN